MDTLKHSPSTHLLSSLIDSFAAYFCALTPTAYHFVIKTLANTHTPQFDQLHLLLDRLENVETFETPEYIFVDLIKIYGDANMDQHAIDLFFRIPKFRCIPTVHSLNALLSILCRKPGGLRVVPQIIWKSQLMNIRIEESSFRVLIKALCRIRRVNYAIALLKYMIDDGFSVDGKMCSLILSKLCDRKDLSGVEVMGFLDEMRELGFCPEREDWGNVISFLVKKGKGLDALDVLHQMKMSGVKPDTVCYTMVLDGVISEGDYENAEELFDEMLVLGLIPDIETYNVYINGLCKQNNTDAVIEMLACMEEMGCNPDLITYNTLLGALCECGELSRASEIFKQMGSKGVRMNSKTCAIMIGGLSSKCEIEEAFRLVEEMAGKCCTHHSSTFDETLCELCRKGLVCKALELLRKIVCKNVGPGARAWEALLLGSGFKHGLEETALMDLLNPT